MIREADPRDEPVLRDLQGELSAPSPCLLTYAMSGPPLVLVSGRPPVAYLLALLGKDAYVAELVVRPDRRREGLASALLDAVLDRARAVGCDAVRLAVRPGNDPARRLYREAGFCVEERVPDYYADGPALVMSRSP